MRVVYRCSKKLIGLDVRDDSEKLNKEHQDVNLDLAQKVFNSLAGINKQIETVLAIKSKRSISKKID